MNRSLISIIHKLATGFCTRLLFLFSLSIVSVSAEAACDYQINQVSPFFFSANITVTNTGSVDVTNFDVIIDFTDATNISNAFIRGNYSINRSGTGPFTIAAQGGGGNSGTLSVGSSVVLTIQGQGGAAIPASLTGSLCNFVVQNQSLTIVKEIINDDGGTATLSEFGLSTNAGFLTFGTPTGIGTTADPLVYTSSPIPVTAAETYSLIELDVAGYTEGTWSCSGNSGGFSNTFDAGSVEIFEDEDVVCTITNNDDAGAFSGQCEHTINSFTGGFNGTIEITNTGVLPINGWEVVWSYSDGSVIQNSFNVVRTGSNPYTGSNVGSDFGFNGNIPVGGSVVFGFSGSGGGVLESLTGNYCSSPVVIASQTLTIEKKILNDNGGAAIVSDFAITTDAGSLIFNPGNTQGDTTTYQSAALTVNPGTYTLTESDLGAYTEGTWECTGTTGTVIGTFNSGSVDIGSGEDVTCVITNDDIPPEPTVQTANLTLVKLVSNTPGGGSAVATDWTLEANINGGAAEISGTSGVSEDVLAGDYVLSELNGPSAYVLQSLVCDDGILDASSNTLTLAAGDNALCTFTNRELVVDLTIDKTVSNAAPNIGETITFTLTIVNNGPDQATNVTVNDTVNAGFSFITNSMTGGDSQNQSAPGLAWMIDSIAAGVSNAVILNYQVTVASP